MHRSVGLRMDVLMTEQMNQCQVAVDAFASLRERYQVVKVEFFIIEEGLSTFWTSTLLSLGENRGSRSGLILGKVYRPLPLFSQTRAMLRTVYAGW